MKEIYKSHVKLVKDLKKNPKDILDSLDPFKVDLLHMAIGISGEAAELSEYSSEENLKEELGDLLFYITGTLVVLDYDWYEADQQTRMILKNPSKSQVKELLKGEVSFLDINIAAGQYLDVIKKICIYEKLYFDGQIFLALCNFLSVFLKFVRAKGFDLERLMSENIIKLRIRHGNKFSNQTAIEKIDHK